MKAIELRKTGGPEVLHVRECPDPIPAPEEVLVDLHYSGINYAEILSRKGLYGWAVRRPYVLGMEGAGVIVAAGEQVNPSRVGQRVIVGTQYGCYAEKVVVPRERAIPALPHYSMAENAAFVVNYMTAWVSLFSLARLQLDEKVLITAAAGGVGTAAVQLAVQQGCEAFGMAGSPEKIAFLESLNVSGAVNYRHSAWPEQLRDLTGGGVDVVLEMVGGKIYRESFELLNPFGRLVVAGFASLDLQKWNPLSWWRTWREMPKVSVMKLARKTGAVMASHLGYLLNDPPRMMAVFADLQAYVTKKEIRPVIGKIFPFAEAARAHEWIESRQSIGKVLLQHDAAAEDEN